MNLSGRRPSLSTRPWTERQRIVLLSLIGTNLAVFVAQLFLDMYQPGFVRSYLALSNRGIHEAYAWEFVTAMFLHYGPWHLLGNMLVLYFLGRDLESILGQRHFLYLYLAGAIGGELGHFMPVLHDDDPVTHGDDFRHIGGRHDDGLALLEQINHYLVDLLL